MRKRQQPSTRHPRLCESRRDEARRPRLPMLPRVIRKATDHTGKADAVCAPGRPVVSVALATDAGLLMSSVTSSSVTVCGGRASGDRPSPARGTGEGKRHARAGIRASLASGYGSAACSEAAALLVCGATPGMACGWGTTAWWRVPQACVYSAPKKKISAE